MSSSQTPGFRVADVELVTRASGTAAGLVNRATVRVADRKWTEYIRGSALLVTLVCLFVLVAYALFDSWENYPSNRSWLILGLGFYIGTAVKVLYETTIHVFDRLWFLRVEIRRVTAETLFEAVSNILTLEAELSGVILTTAKLGK